MQRGGVALAVIVVIVFGLAVKWAVMPLLDELDASQRAAKVSNPFGPGEAPGVPAGGGGAPSFPTAAPGQGDDRSADERLSEPTVRKTVRAAAANYLALLRAGHAAEAYKSLPAAAREKVTEAAHAAWWKRALAPEELEEAVVAGIGVDPYGADVSIAGGSRLLLLRVGPEPKSPTVLPWGLLPLSQSAPESGGPWFPIAEGRGGVFRVRLESRIDPKTMGAQPVNQVRSERWTVRYAPALAGGFKGFEEITAIDVLAPDGSSVERTEERRMLEPRKDGVFVTAVEGGEPGKLVPQIPSPAVLRLPAKPKTTWQEKPVDVTEELDLEEMSGGSVRLQQAGGVLGWEDVRAPSGEYAGALVVRRMGALTGIVNLYGMEGRVQSGTVSTTSWFAPGVGLVREIEQTSLRLRFPDGTGGDLFITLCKLRDKDPGPPL